MSWMQYFKSSQWWCLCKEVLSHRVACQEELAKLCDEVGWYSMHSFQPESILRSRVWSGVQLVLCSSFSNCSCPNWDCCNWWVLALKNYLRKCRQTKNMMIDYHTIVFWFTFSSEAIAIHSYHDAFLTFSIKEKHLFALQCWSNETSITIQ